MTSVTHSPGVTKERRSGTDRRQFSYAAHVPERRSGRDRRKGKTDERRFPAAK